MWQTDSFIYSTELVALLLGLIVHFFIKTNKPRRTLQFKVILTGTGALMLELLAEIILNMYTIISSAPSRSIINVTCFIIWLLHVLVICTLLIYLYRMSDLPINIKSMNLAITILILVFLIGGIFLLYKGNMYTISDGNFHLVYMFSYIEFVSFLSTAIFFTNAIRSRVHYPKALFNYIAAFVPVIMALQILQVFSNTIVFSGIIYMIPFSVLYFMYHNTPHNQSTGIQDSPGLIGNMDNIIGHSKPYIMIHLTANTVSSSEDEIPVSFEKAVWKYCRDIEYLDSNIDIYKSSQNSISILITSISKKKRELTLQKIKEATLSTLKDYSGIFSAKALIFKENDAVDSSEKGRELVKYLQKLYQDDPHEFLWHEVTEEEYQNFQKMYEIKNAVIELLDSQNLEDDRVVCYAQPILNVASNSFRTAEALMRFKLNDNFISPIDVIPVAEVTNCIHTITKIMLNKVCSFIEKNEDEYYFDGISVNCSMIELYSPIAADEFLAIIKSHHIDPAKLRIEITESTAAESFTDKENVRKNMKKLYDQGIRFYLDDYGTGYSNLARLISLKLHTIKFDKSLLYKSMENPSLEEIDDTMIQVFKKNGTKVLVEGVETEEQDSYAKAHGFEYIQGYKYSKPIEINKLTDFFEKRS